VALETVDRVPALHAVQILAPRADQVPALQFKQAAEEVAIIEEDHKPAKHIVQELDPEFDHVPALQARQAEDDIAPELPE
jgi:hypothetical protein